MSMWQLVDTQSVSEVLPVAQAVKGELVGPELCSGEIMP